MTSSFLLVGILFQTVILWNLSSISAQTTYQNNFQQYLQSFIKEDNIQVNAIDNANNGTYAIAGTVRRVGFKPKKPLLTKLSKNKPMSNPFDVLWAKSYHHPYDPNVDFNVHDVLYTDQGDYVIAGQVNLPPPIIIYPPPPIEGAEGKQEESPYRGFLLRTDADGSPVEFRVYSQLNSLKSVQQHPDGQGFVAVGDSIKHNGAVLSVTYGLDPLCANEVRGNIGKIDLVVQRLCLLSIVSHFVAMSILK